jgi:hypothetical protein
MSKNNKQMSRKFLKLWFSAGQKYKMKNCILLRSGTIYVKKEHEKPSYQMMGF